LQRGHTPLHFNKPPAPGGWLKSARRYREQNGDGAVISVPNQQGGYDNG
jgi:hypothetical protein